MAKVAIVGCGAMGSVYAALMADAGHEVNAVTLWPDHAEAMIRFPRDCFDHESINHADFGQL